MQLTQDPASMVLMPSQPLQRPIDKQSNEDFDENRSPSSKQRFSAMSKPQIAAFLQKRIRKTRICVHYLNGKCSHGAQCTFAHSPEELRELPNLYKTRLCVEYMKSPNGCARGETCKYAHGMTELRATEEVYKTALCSTWNTNGTCSSGNRCRWAHGPHELRKGSAMQQNRLQQSEQATQLQAESYYDYENQQRPLAPTSNGTQVESMNFHAMRQKESTMDAPTASSPPANTNTLSDMSKVKFLQTYKSLFCPTNPHPQHVAQAPTAADYGSIHLMNAGIRPRGPGPAVHHNATPHDGGQSHNISYKNHNYGYDGLQSAISYHPTNANQLAAAHHPRYRQQSDPAQHNHNAAAAAAAVAAFMNSAYETLPDYYSAMIQQQRQRQEEVAALSGNLQASSSQSMKHNSHMGQAHQHLSNAYPAVLRCHNVMRADNEASYIAAQPAQGRLISSPSTDVVQSAATHYMPSLQSHDQTPLYEM